MQVHDVFLHIIPNAKPVELSSEADPTSKLMEYLKAVKYKPPMDAGSFRLALANGARDVVYSLLKWLLSQVPVLQRRATIGIYLTMPEVPQEFRGIQVRHEIHNWSDQHTADMRLVELVSNVQEISNCITEIQALQGEFKELHQQVEEVKASMPSVDELSKMIQRKENERASLRSRTAKAKEKAQACVSVT
jgi:intraflagellar transport protein 81